jgi:hemolysin III
MTKSEFLEAKKGLAIEKDEIEENAYDYFREQKKQYREQKRNLRFELKEEKKEYRQNKREAKQDYREKKEYLTNKFQGNRTKDVKVRERYLSDDEIYALRKKNQLPKYTHKEEMFNMITHIVGGGLGVVALIVSIICCALFRPKDATSMVSMIIFSVTMIVLYTNSAIYHGLNINRGKQVFQVIDHCTIYILIAGSYTPVVLLGLPQLSPWHYVLLASVYALAILGVVLNATMMRKKAVKIISMILYIMIGWCIIFFYPWLKETLKLGGTWLLIVGGITYTIGSILYGIGSKKKYWHSIFHLFCLGGTISQFLSVLLFAVIGLSA